MGVFLMRRWSGTVRLTCLPRHIKANARNIPTESGTLGDLRHAHADDRRHDDGAHGRGPALWPENHEVEDAQSHTELRVHGREEHRVAELSREWCGQGAVG